MTDNLFFLFSTALPDGSYPPTTTLHTLVEDELWDDIFWRINGIDWQELLNPRPHLSSVSSAQLVDRIKSSKGFLVYPVVSVPALPPIPELCLRRCSDGKLPFHVAVDNFAPLFVSTYLLGDDMHIATHYVAGFGFPLHYVCSHSSLDMPLWLLSGLISTLIRRFPLACVTRSPNGDYPLHALTLTLPGAREKLSPKNPQRTPPADIRDACTSLYIRLELRSIQI